MDWWPSQSPRLLIIEVCVRVGTWAWLCVAQCLLSVQAQADVSSVGWRGVAAGACPHVVSPSTRHRALGP